MGLPASQEQFSCPGGTCSFDNSTLLGANRNLYDNAVNYAAAPSNGVLTAKRVFLHWSGSDPRYSDTVFGYDTWGNQTSVEVLGPPRNATDRIPP